MSTDLESLENLENSTDSTLEGHTLVKNTYYCPLVPHDFLRLLQATTASPSYNCHSGTLKHDQIFIIQGLQQLGLNTSIGAKNTTRNIHAYRP